MERKTVAHPTKIRTRNESFWNNKNKLQKGNKNFPSCTYILLSIYLNLSRFSHHVICNYPKKQNAKMEKEMLGRLVSGSNEYFGNTLSTGISIIYGNKISFNFLKKKFVPK